jgi:hypothetical protein
VHLNQRDNRFLWLSYFCLRANRNAGTGPDTAGAYVEQRVLFCMPKIVRFHQVGGPEVLKLEELPAPQPQKGEVRIKVDAIGLNRAEVMFRSGLIRSSTRIGI